MKLLTTTVAFVPLSVLLRVSELTNRPSVVTIFAEFVLTVNVTGAFTKRFVPCQTATDNNCGNPLEMCLCDALAAEYERGKRHGLDDRKMIERHNQEQGREITALKIEVSQLKMQLYDLRFGAKKTS